jgi:hypothetical protein
MDDDTIHYIFSCHAPFLRESMINLFYIDFDLIVFLHRTSTTRPLIRLSGFPESHQFRRSQIGHSTSRPPVPFRFNALSFHSSSEFQ